MPRELINAVLEKPQPETIAALLKDNETVFWVDWRADDDSIAESCENGLRTGELSGELVEVDMADGYEVFVRHRARRVRVPLTYSAADRHLTLCALNQVLQPDDEIRFCIDSRGSDTLAFLPLPTRSWMELEKRHGPTVARVFHRVASSPNLFTGSLPSFQTNRTDPRTKTQQPSVAAASSARKTRAGRSPRRQGRKIRRAEAEGF